MIELHLPVYCQHCSEFEADVIKNSYHSDSKLICHNTTIRCKHEQRCDTILLYLDQMYRNAKGAE